MDKRYENIKQAEHPITVLEWTGTDGSSTALNGQGLSVVYGRNYVVDYLEKFIAENQDNPLVNNPFDADGMYEDKEFLYQAYDSNVALSNWNMVKDSYGERLDALVTEALPKRSFHSEKEYERTMLCLGAHICYAKDMGLSDDQIDYMLDHSMTASGYVDGEDLDYLSHQFTTSPDKAVFLYENVNLDARQAVGFYMERCSSGELTYDPEMVKALGAAQDMGEGYRAYEAIIYDNMSKEEVSSVIQAVNQFFDKRNEFAAEGRMSEYHAMYHHNMGERLTVALFDAKERGLNLTDGSPQTLVSNFLQEEKVPDFDAYLDDYLSTMESLHSNEKNLDRIVFQDNGVVSGKDGKSYHKVDFAYACDQKSVETDKQMPNPYLGSWKHQGADGNSYVTHSYYLSENVYNRLMSAANTEGMKDSRWTGIVAAKVGSMPSKDGKYKPVVDLTQKAFENGNVMKPLVPFNERKHDVFVKQSLANMYAKRELPNVEMPQETTEDTFDLR